MSIPEYIGHQRFSWNQSTPLMIFDNSMNERQSISADSSPKMDDGSYISMGGHVLLDYNRNNATNRSQYISHSRRELSGSVPEITGHAKQLVDLDLSPDRVPLPRATSNVAISTSFSDALKKVSSGLERLWAAQNHPRQRTREKEEFAKDVCGIFYTAGLYDPHLVSGEDIVQIVRFTAGVPIHEKCSITSTKQEKKVKVLHAAIFKECGFIAQVSILPLICCPYQIRRLQITPRNSDKPPLFVVSKLLKLQRPGDSARTVYLDESGRVYKSVDDWTKTNHFSPAIVYIPQMMIPHPYKTNDGSYPFRIGQFMTPSCRTSKKALDAFDIIIGIGIVGAGAACIVATGGLALPIVAAGQLAGSVYLGVRGSMSLIDSKRHRPKCRV